MHIYDHVPNLITELRPTNPIYLHRPQAIENSTRFFLNNFLGKVLYAVKTNPDEMVLKQIHALGVDNFDVASLEEIKTISGLFPEANMYYMHPVKPRHAIRTAYFDYGIRNFSLDSLDEFQKILCETNHARDLNLFIRVGVSDTYSAIKLNSKFGINPKEAILLLRAIRKHTAKLGICFHVGSQCMNPEAYTNAVSIVDAIVKEAGVKIDILDIGGGFPSVYPGMQPPAIKQYFDAIHNSIKNSSLNRCELLAEPGRAIVAESGSIVTRVELRKGQYLYLNDGTYGNLFDAGTPGVIFPTRLIRPNDSHAFAMSEFSFYGPTCDSLDVMQGPFLLPKDTREGDYIEIGQLGAYGRTLSTRFNGFGSIDNTYLTSEEPLMSLYSSQPEQFDGFGSIDNAYLSEESLRSLYSSQIEQLKVVRG
jgi:ornithine decarboxylase